LDEIETLADRAAMPVAVDRDGEPRELPPVVDRGAYRVVRDALAAAEVASAATIAIRYVPGALVVQIDDDGGAERASLERAADIAAALGGGLRATLQPGGFRVKAWLPTEGQPRSRAARPAVR
jgi:signal transduction histidine kinase